MNITLEMCPRLAVSTEGCALWTRGGFGDPRGVAPRSDLERSRVHTSRISPGNPAMLGRVCGCGAFANAPGVRLRAARLWLVHD
eukprot:3555726-Prymnesium_polylepis.1